MVKNPALIDHEESKPKKMKQEKKRNKRNEDMFEDDFQDEKKANSFEEVLKDPVGLHDQSYQSSLDSENDKAAVQNPVFVQQKQEQKMRLERNNRYQHIICSIVLDK